LPLFGQTAIEKRLAKCVCEAENSDPWKTQIAISVSKNLSKSAFTISFGFCGPHFSLFAAPKFI
ncbi:MAG: hypothetical protein FWG05_01185, partial [Kiritimatiellaeota bacterium]|nr:hypothetical protein [Kiritimatiellota bacterium]